MLIIPHMNKISATSLIYLLVFALSLSTSFVLKADDSTKSKNPITLNVDIKLFTFKPKVLEITSGTTVVWTNRDAIKHSVTSGSPENPGKDFDSGFFTQGESYSFTFTKPGVYTYFCKRHESMRGTVKVVE